MRSLLIVMIGLLVWISSAVQAQDYPERVDLYVNDYANLLTPAEEDSLRELIEQASATLDLTILTIRSTSEYDPSLPSTETFATYLFNEWEIGDGEENRGVLILIVLTEQSVRIELGAGFADEYDEAMRAIIDEVMTPYLSEGNVAEGLRAGVREVYGQLSGQGVASMSSPFEVLIHTLLNALRP